MSSEERNAGQTKAAPKAKAAVATVPPSKLDELTKQLRYQQHQIDALVGHVKYLVSAVRAMQASSSGPRPGNLSFGRGSFGMQTQSTWRGDLGEGPCPSDSGRIHSPVNRQKSPTGAGGCQNIQTQSVLAMWRGGAFEA